MPKALNVIIERDEDGFYIATVPSLPDCHTQAKGMDELLERIKEAISLYLEVERDGVDFEAEIVPEYLCQVKEVPLYMIAKEELKEIESVVGEPADYRQKDFVDGEE